MKVRGVCFCLYRWLEGLPCISAAFAQGIYEKPSCPRLGKAMSKRVEMESGRRKASKPPVLEKTHALEKATDTKPQSGLANRLSHLWARGVLSAIMVRDLAQLALGDGAGHADLIKLAECANWGGTHTGRS